MALGEPIVRAERTLRADRASRAERVVRKGSAPAEPGRRSKQVSPRAGVEFGRLDALLGFHLRLAHAASFRSFSQHVGDGEGNPGWFSVLALIEANPGIGQTELSRAAGRDKSTLTATLAALCGAGLVRRSQVDADRRRNALELTAAGRQTLERLAARAVAHETEIARILGPTDYARVLRALQRIGEALA